MKEKRWLVYAILAAASWGIWGILTKFISGDINPFATHFMFTVGALFTLPLVLRNCKIKEANVKGISLGIGASILAVIGNVSIYQSFNMGGQAAVIIPLTNLYPLITIVIALLIFKEKLNWINGLGIFIVIPAILLLSGQSSFFDGSDVFYKNIEFQVWLIFAILTLFLFGIFSALQKVISNYLSTGWAYLSFVVSSVLVSVCFFAFGLIDFNFSEKTFWLGSSAGFLDGLGVLSIYWAYQVKGKASKVSSIAAALQQVFTVILAIVFLDEMLSLDASIGIFLAILGAYLLSFETTKTS
ncbi:DMT family transporter [Aquipluma nitroreducens]|uniref:DMT family transporter n=1 Tax=Aquipluma nitroreducens TaxID=2010828 RepID=UPI00296F650A|nr:DMT family transporter [Aquipluma nitroreducens]